MRVDHQHSQKNTNAPVSQRKRNHLLWVGPIVVFAGIVSYFLYFFQFPVLRDFPWLNLPITIFGVILSGIALWRAFVLPQVYRGRILGSLGLALALGLASLFGFYVFYLSYQMPGVTPVTANLKTAPDIQLSDHEGCLVRLTDLRGKKVVLTFYRGHW